MLSQILTIAALCSNLAFAVPTAQREPVIVKWEAPAFGDPFGIAATGKNIINASLRAVGGAIYIGGTQDDVKCELNQQAAFATFVWDSEKKLYLYTNTGPVQQVKVDQSTMGQGVTFYTTGDQQVIPGLESPWEINNSTRVVTFGTTGAKACPTGEKVDQAEVDQKYRVWFTELEKPAFTEGCVDVELLAYRTLERSRCDYSSSA